MKWEEEAYTRRDDDGNLISVVRSRHLQAREEARGAHFSHSKSMSVNKQQILPASAVSCRRET